MRISIGRTIAYAIAGLICAASLFQLIFAHNHRRNFHQWEQARPIDIPVDFSKPGQFTGGFVQTCQISHGEAICLTVPSNAVANTTWSKLLADLQFVSLIKDQSGHEITRVEFTGESLERDHLIDGAILLVTFQPFKNGTYHMTLTVKHGAPALRGVPQHLVARYMLCGIERMPAIIALVTGICGLIIAAVILAITACVAKRKPTTGAQRTPVDNMPPGS